jgi:hypothetical protein
MVSRPRQQNAESDQMVRLLSGWWDRVRLWEKARDAAKRARAYGRGYLRLWLPAGLLDARSVIDPSAENEEQAETVVDALPSGLSAEDAFRRLQLSAPDPLEAAIYVDSDTQEQVAVFLFRDKEDEDGAELWTVNPATGDAVVRVVSQDAAIQAATYPKIPLAGRLPIAEMEADILITEPVRRQQASLDFGESIVNRTLETAGFPERAIRTPSRTGSGPSRSRSGNRWTSMSSMARSGISPQPTARSAPRSRQSLSGSRLTTG